MTEQKNEYSYSEMRKEVLDWWNGDFNPFYDDGKNAHKTLHEKIELYLREETDFTMRDYGYELEDCKSLISICNAAIKKYPNIEDFKKHLKNLNKMYNNYTHHYKNLYKDFVKEWKNNHSGIEFKGMKPPCFNEWFENDFWASKEKD